MRLCLSLLLSLSMSLSFFSMRQTFLFSTSLSGGYASSHVDASPGSFGASRSFISIGMVARTIFDTVVEVHSIFDMVHSRHAAHRCACDKDAMRCKATIWSQRRARVGFSWQRNTDSWEECCLAACFAMTNMATMTSAMLMQDFLGQRVGDRTHERPHLIPDFLSHGGVPLPSLVHVAWLRFV